MSGSGGSDMPATYQEPDFLQRHSLSPEPDGAPDAGRAPGPAADPAPYPAEDPAMDPDDELPPDYARQLPPPRAESVPAPVPPSYPAPDPDPPRQAPQGAGYGPYARPPVAPQSPPPVAPPPPQRPPLPQPSNPYLNPHPTAYAPPPRAAAPPVDARQPDQQGGWRRVVGRARGSAPSAHDRQRVARLQRPTAGPYRLSVTSIKGGVGKTTTSAMLGLTFARYRADNTVVVDANPHAGTLADRLLGERVTPTVRDLVNAEMRERAQRPQGLVDAARIHQYLGQAGRLMVAASEQNSDLSDAFDEEQYRTSQEVLARAFDVIITDSGTGMRHSAMRGTLAATDRLIVVAAPRYDAARRAAKTLDEVYARGYPHLVRDAVVVITMDAPKAVGINVDTLVDYFQQLCTAVVRIPYDQHLYSGGTIDYDRVSAGTRGAYMDLAALLADNFQLPRP